MNLIEKIKKAVDVRQVLDHYGAQRISGNGVLRSTCILHRGDNPSALVFDETSKLWYCHTGCQTGGDVIDFVQQAEKCEFREAVEILAQMFDIPVDWDNEDIDEDYFRDDAKHFIDYMRRKEADLEDLPLYELKGNKLNVNRFREFSKEVIDHYGLQVTTDGELHDRLTLPLEDGEGRVVGYSGRRIKADVLSKWMHKPNGLQMGHIVPGIGRNFEWIQESMEVIVVEGPFDGMRLWDRGYKNVTHIMGANITDEQVREIQKVSFSVILGYDNDMAGRNATRKAIGKLEANSDISILLLPEGKDPCDCNGSETEIAFTNRIKPFEFYERYGKDKEKRG